MNQRKILIKPILIKYINKMKNENIIKLEIDNKTETFGKVFKITVVLENICFYLFSDFSFNTYCN